MLSPHWRIAAASVTGTAHEAANIPCQDRHRCDVLADGTLLVAVADGAGSRPHAEQGADLAVTVSLQALARDLAGAPAGDEIALTAAMHNAFAAVRAAIDDWAAAHAVAAGALATTLTCVVAAPAYCLVGQIGDGAAILQCGAELQLPIQPQRGDFANETFFLTGAGAAAATAFLPGRVDAVVVMTDGLTMLALQGVSKSLYEPFAPFYEPLLRFVRQAEDDDSPSTAVQQLLASERVCARTGDDKTLVVAARSTAAAPA